MQAREVHALEWRHMGQCTNFRWCVTTRDGFSGDLLAHWCDRLDKFYLRVAYNFSFRVAKGGNKDQLWFSLEKKQVVWWKTVVFAGKRSYTVVVMPRP